MLRHTRTVSATVTVLLDTLESFLAAFSQLHRQFALPCLETGPNRPPFVVLSHATDSSKVCPVVPPGDSQSGLRAPRFRTASGGMAWSAGCCAGVWLGLLLAPTGHGSQLGSVAALASGLCSASARSAWRRGLGVHWATGLEVWRRLVGGVDKFSLEDFFRQRDGGGEGDPERRPKFRVTCNRAGQVHKFTSMEAAAIFGGAVNDAFHWGVDMKHFDLEVVLNIGEEAVYVCLGLTRGSLHHRNLDQFGPTSLRCTIAYNMLRLCDLRPGDIVCDPMCGGGSIPIE
ncbi:hypothetical protein HPB47_018761, partial [Ixodes persulcatus]